MAEKKVDIFTITEEPIEKLLNVGVENGQIVIRLDCEKIIRPMLDNAPNPSLRNG